MSMKKAVLQHPVMGSLLTGFGCCRPSLWSQGPVESSKVWSGLKTEDFAADVARLPKLWPSVPILFLPILWGRISKQCANMGVCRWREILSTNEAWLWELTPPHTRCEILSLLCYSPGPQCPRSTCLSCDFLWETFLDHPRLIWVALMWDHTPIYSALCVTVASSWPVPIIG